MKEPEVTSVGETLSSARKKKRLRYKKLSSELNIEESYLIALEEENYSFIPGGEAYVKGFLRSYAKKLNLDPEIIIKAFVASKGTSLKKNTSPRPQLRKYSKLRLRSISIFILIIAILIFMYVFTLDNDQDYQSSINLAESPQTASTTKYVDTAYDLNSSSSAQHKGATSKIMIDGIILGNELEVHENVKKKEIIFKEDLVKNSTVLKVSKECWLEVYSNQERLLYKLSEPGEEFSFNEETLKIIVGNFKNVEILFNDKIVNLESYANKKQVSCIVLPIEDCDEF